MSTVRWLRFSLIAILGMEALAHAGPRIRSRPGRSLHDTPSPRLLTHPHEHTPGGLHRALVHGEEAVWHPPAPPAEPSQQGVSIHPPGAQARLSEAVILEQLRSTPALNVFVSAPEHVPVARRAVAQLPGARRLVIYKRTTESLESQLIQLGEPITTLETLYTVPTSTAEALRVHGDAARQMSDAYWPELQSRMKRELSAPTARDTRDLPMSEGSMAERTHHQLQSSSARLLVLIGEVRGGALRFPDGSALPTAEATRGAGARGKVVAIVGCTSARHIEPGTGNIAIGTGRKILYSEAIDISLKFERALRQGNVSPRDLLLQFQEGEAVAAGDSMVGVAVLERRIGMFAGGILLEWVNS
jgi:hypothetical protein